MSKFKVGDKVIRVRNGSFGKTDIGSIVVVERLIGDRFFWAEGHDYYFDEKSFDLYSKSEILVHSISKAKELQLEISVRQKELEDHLNVLKEHGVQLIEGATHVA